MSETLNYSWGRAALHPPLQLPAPECLLGGWGLLFPYKQGLTGAPLVAQTVKNLPAMQETWVQSLDQEDPLQKGLATHSSILAGRIPWTEEPGVLQSMRSQRVRHN